MNTIQPVLFIGHGSPMNAVEDNEFSQAWKALGEKLEKPKGIISISAHWYTDSSYTQSEANPKQIYDMYGFPRSVYELKYPTIGDIELTNKILACDNHITINDSWGIDHGTWSVLCHLVPNHDIPVVQIAIDKTKSFEEHFNLAQKLKPLREEGYLILCSGNIVHNLANVNFTNPNGLPKLMQFDDYIKDAILNNDFSKIINPQEHKYYIYAAPTPDHYIPLIYACGLVNDNDKIEVFNDKGVFGTISMTSYYFY